MPQNLVSGDEFSHEKHVQFNVYLVLSISSMPHIAKSNKIRVLNLIIVMFYRRLTRIF